MRRAKTLAVVVTALAALGLSVACGDGTVQKRREPDPVVEPECGDGKVDEGEACDGSDHAGNTCQTLGFDVGSLTCNASCELVTSQCVKFCGDGVRGPGEECDQQDGPLACGDFGYKACTDACKVDALHCRTVAFESLTQVAQASGGPALLTDLAPEGFGDLVIVDPGFSRLQAYPYELTGGFATSKKLSNDAHQPAWVIAADLDGDGHLDLASINADGSADRYRYSNGTYVTEALTRAADGGSAACLSSWVGAGMLDGDAYADLVALGCSGELVIFPGGAVPPSARVLNPGITLTAAALSGSELLAATSDSKLYRLSAPDFQAGTPDDLGVVATRLAAADFDTDGDADLVLHAGANVLVFENTGSGYAQRKSEAATPVALIAGDLDLDGAPDYAWLESGKVEVRRNLGAFVYTNWPITTGTGTPLTLSAGDLEGDGDPDLAATVRTTGTNTVTYVLRNKVR